MFKTCGAQAKGKNCFLIAAAAVLLFALGVYFRFAHALDLYAAGEDSALFTFWARSIAHAPDWGFTVLFKNFRELPRHPETALYQFAAIIANDPGRVTDSAGVLLAAAWMKILGSGWVSAAWLSMLLGAASSFFAAKISTRLCSAEKGKGLLFLTVFALCFFNPYVVNFSCQLIWHSFELFFIMAACTAAGNEWQSALWSRRKLALMWVLILCALYSVVLIPVIFATAWGLCDLAGSFRKKTFLRTFAFWASLAVCYLPAVLIVSLFGLSKIGYWVGYYWTVSRPLQILIMTGFLAIATGFLFPFALLAREKWKNFSYALMFCALLLGVMFIAMNSAYESRFLVYMLPLISMGAAKVWEMGGRLRAAAGLLALTLVLGQTVMTEKVFGLIAPTLAFQKAAESIPYMHGAQALDKMMAEPGMPVLVFDNRFEAVQVLTRTRVYTNRFIGNLSKLMDSWEAGNESYLEMTHPHLTGVRELVLAVRKWDEETEARISRLFETGPDKMIVFTNALTGETETWHFLFLKRR